MISSSTILNVQKWLNKELVNVLIKEYAKNFSLESQYVYAICMQESSMNPDAVRYEPNFYLKYIKNAENIELEARKIRGVSKETELKLRACSFGIMQVMGQTARELGFNGTFLTELCRIDLGMFFGCAYLQKQLNRYDNYPAAISAYNAGSATDKNKDYVNSILHHTHKYA